MRFHRTGTVRFIEDHRDAFPVIRMCKVLAVSSSGYYAWRKRPPSAREMANQELFKKIEVVYNENHGVYGSPRIYRELDAQGVACSENRVARLMRLHGLQAKQTRRFKTTTNCPQNRGRVASLRGAPATKQSPPSDRGDTTRHCEERQRRSNLHPATEGTPPVIARSARQTSAGCG
jgi:transposase InsO family protein